MIRILATALLALSLTASGAFATSMDDLVERDGVYWKKFTETPFTGKLDEGREQGKLKRGKREGPWIYYRENGQLDAKEEYKNGKKEGPWVTYWPNGRPGAKGAYKNGKREGPLIFYYRDGTKNEDISGTYRNDVKVSD